VTTLPSWDTVTGWASQGQQAVELAASRLDPGGVAEPSRLPGWTRGHVLSHLARNADALVNLLTWARTGTETPMYTSSTDRADGIEAGAYRALPEQLADLNAADERFLVAADAVPAGRREFMVRSAQGREIPASEVPWLRAREVWLHVVDLDADYDVDDMPDDVAWMLAADVAGWMSSRTQVTAELRAEGQPDPVRLGSAPRSGDTGTVVGGTPQRIAGWLTGRVQGQDGLTVTGDLGELPRWL
jgi:maleylpyruvate isomerase